MDGVDAPPLFLDLEASSLASGSYPIEVGWSLPDGGIESHLVSPAGVRDWTDWSREAEGVHGISRAELLRDGRPPAWVCARLLESTAGQPVYSDAASYDRHWLARCFEAAGYPDLPIDVRDIDELPAVRRAMMLDRFVDLAKAVRARIGRRHRAAADVEYLIAVVALANERFG